MFIHMCMYCIVFYSDHNEKAFVFTMLFGLEINNYVLYFILCRVNTRHIIAFIETIAFKLVDNVY